MLNSRVLASRWSKNVPFLREAVRFAHNTVDVASGSDLPQLPRLNNKKLFSDNTKRAQFTRRPREKNENDYSEISSSTFTPRRERIRYKEKLSNERVIRPAVQSSRVKELMDSGDFDTAVKLLTESKPDTLNVPVYNTVIHGFMRAGKRKEAYRIFIDMKRRGIEPTINTYLALLLGMSKIEDWKKNPAHLEKCHTIYAEYLERRQKFIGYDKSEDGRTGINDPLVFYVKILGDAGLFQKVFDVFYGLEESGAAAPDSKVYSAFFKALAARKSIDESNGLTLSEQNAADARLIWRRLEKDAEDNGVHVDAIVLSQVISLLTRGRQSDHQLTLEIIRKYCGLAEPGEVAEEPRIKLSGILCTNILAFCNKTGRYRLCLNFNQQMDGLLKEDDPDMNNYRTNEKLAALGGLAALSALDESKQAVDAIKDLINESVIRYQKVQIAPKTYALALAVCWKCNDWESACEIFDLATGLQIEKFSDDGVITTGVEQCEKTPEEIPRNLYLIAWTHLARTALATGQNKHMQQFLRAASYVGVRLEMNSTLAKGIHTDYYKYQFSHAIVGMWKSLKHGSEESREWNDNFVNKARKILTDNRGHNKSWRIPEGEHKILGSEKYLSKVSQSIEDEMYSRRNV